MLKRDSATSPLKIFKVKGWVNSAGEFLKHGVQQQHCQPGKLYHFTRKQGLYAKRRGASRWDGRKICLWMSLDGVASESSKNRPVVHFWKCKEFPKKLKDDIETAGFGAEARQAYEGHWVPNGDDEPVVYAWGGDGQWFWHEERGNYRLQPERGRKRPWSW